MPKFGSASSVLTKGSHIYNHDKIYEMRFKVNNRCFLSNISFFLSRHLGFITP